MDPMYSFLSYRSNMLEIVLSILTDYYRSEPKMAAQIFGKPDSTALTVKQMSHLSQFGSIFSSEAIETILDMP